MALHYPSLKKTKAKFEAGENFGAVVTFPTEAVAEAFLQEISKDDQDYLETGLIAKINEKQLYFTLEFAAVLYAYPGESFDHIRLQELNKYTGYSMERPLKTTKQKEATEAKATANHSPSIQTSLKAKSSLLRPKVVTDKDKTPFRRENFIYNYYNEEECSLFLGEKLTDEDKRLLALLENGCSYRTLALYLIKIHRQEPEFVQNVINELAHEHNYPQSLTPQQVLTTIQLKLDNRPSIT